MLTNKYAAAIIGIVFTVLTAFVALPESQRDPATLIGLVLVGLGAFGTYLLPLLKGGWAAALKVAAAVLAAVLSAVVPFVVTGTVTPTQWVIVALAAVNALAVQLGVDLRQDSRKARHAIQDAEGVYQVTGLSATL